MTEIFEVILHQVLKTARELLINESWMKGFAVAITILA